MSAQPDRHHGDVPIDEAIRWSTLPRADGREEPEDGDLVPLGVDVTALPPAELADHGIELRPRSWVLDGPQTARVWLAHSEVAARYPKHDRVARATAREAAAFWWRRRRTLKGLRIHRSFPCLGKFRVANEGAETGPLIVVCDVCGDRFGVDRDEFAKALDDSLK